MFLSTFEPQQFITISLWTSGSHELSLLCKCMFKTTFWQFFFNELSETKTDNLSQKDEAFGGGGGQSHREPHYHFLLPITRDI